jgi:hypothetical protein
MKCTICKGDAERLGQLLVLGKHTANYQRCKVCGFVQVVDPKWLKEAYADAITCTDIGPVWRADYFSKITKTIIHAFSDPKGAFVDYGAGYGLFVRKMRDLGYDFRWHDKYSVNLLARGFEAPQRGTMKFQLVTAFEVFEHLVDPMTEIPEICEYGDGEVLFTTELISRQPPPLDEWWYYAPEHGQHIAFYTEDSLRHIARQLGLEYFTDGVNLHFFTRKKMSPRIFKLVIRERVREWFDFIYRRPSLLIPDFEAGRKRALDLQNNVDAERISHRESDS